MIRGSVSEDFSEQQRVLDQAGTWDVQETPEVQFPAEGGLQAALQEVLHTPVLLFLVQQSFGCKLVAAVSFVGVQTGQLRRRRRRFLNAEAASALQIINVHPYPVYDYLSNLSYCSIRASLFIQFLQ